jgi:hypothetical protein
VASGQWWVEAETRLTRSDTMEASGVMALGLPQGPGCLYEHRRGEAMPVDMRAVPGLQFVV